MRHNIHIQSQPGALTDHLDLEDYSSFVILTDEHTRALCLPKLLDVNPLLNDALILEIPAGEPYKQLSTCEQLWQTLFHHHIDRKALFINLGGGVVGDMGGFVAATYKRGIHFIQLPTTLLAQVDASVGGKTGIDFGVLKNGIGCYAEPRAVFVYTDFLKTLTPGQFLSGYAELFKHALLSGGALWQQVKAIKHPALETIAPLLQPAIAYKQQVVEQDPKEQGLRKVLNFGHTLGHALESAALEAETPLLHGHAVALGMLGELWISHNTAGLPVAEYEAATHLIRRIYGEYLPVQLPDVDKLLTYIRNDKKNERQSVNFTLLKAIGQPQYNCTASPLVIKEALAFMKAAL